LRGDGVRRWQPQRIPSAECYRAKLRAWVHHRQAGIASESPVPGAVGNAPKFSKIFIGETAELSLFVLGAIFFRGIEAAMIKSRIEVPLISFFLRTPSG
jgi:hypothetical protein